LKDAHDRQIDYLRVSITDRCNLRCQYCMPAGGVDLKDHDSILSYEEMLRIISAAVEVGFSKIRLTGGEPLVRKHLADAFVRPIAEMEGVTDVSMTTNAVRLPPVAKELKEAGLTRVNISLDTLDPEMYSWLTRGGDIAEATAGIDAAFEAGFKPLKVNALALAQLKDGFADIAGLSIDRPIHVRFIEYMPIGAQNLKTEESYIPMADVIAEIEKTYPLEDNAGPMGWGPAVYKKIPGSQGTVGFIRAESHEFCENCNRMRVTSDGRLRGCLFASGDTSLLELVRSKAPLEELVAVFEKCLVNKPKERENRRSPGQMSSIGG